MIVTMLYVTSPRLIYLITGSLYLLTTYTRFAHLHSFCPPTPALATTNLVSVSMSLVFSDSTYKWDHMIFIFLCLTYFISNSIEGFKSRLDQAAERISELKDRAVEFIQLEEQKEKRINKNEDIFRNLWDINKHKDVHIIQIIKGEDREKAYSKK